MKQILGVVFAVALMASGAHAAGGEGQRGERQQPGQQQQQLGAQPGQQQQMAAQERTIQGEVTAVEENQLTLEVAGERMTIHGEAQQFRGVEQGQQVQVTIVPQLEASKVERLGDPQSKQLSGTAEEIQENVLTLRDQQGQEHKIQIDQQQAEDIQQGQEVLIELERAPAEAKDYRAVGEVQPAGVPSPEGMQPGQQPGQQQQQHQEPGQQLGQ
jgi:hypothetical protein